MTTELDGRSMMETHDVVAVHSPTHSTNDDEPNMVDFSRQT